MDPTWATLSSQLAALSYPVPPFLDPSAIPLVSALLEDVCTGTQLGVELSAATSACATCRLECATLLEENAALREQQWATTNAPRGGASAEAAKLQFALTSRDKELAQWRAAQDASSGATRSTSWGEVDAHASARAHLIALEAEAAMRFREAPHAATSASSLPPPPSPGAARLRSTLRSLDAQAAAALAAHPAPKFDTGEVDALRQLVSSLQGEVAALRAKLAASQVSQSRSALNVDVVAPPPPPPPPPTPSTGSVDNVVGSLTLEVGRLTSDLHTAESQRAAAVASAASARSEASSLTAELAAAAARCDALSRELAASRLELSSLRAAGGADGTHTGPPAAVPSDEVAALRSQLTRLTQRCVAAEAAEEAAVLDKDFSRTRIADLNRDLTVAAARVDAAVAERDGTLRELVEANSTLKEQAAELQAGRATLFARDAALTEAKADVSSLQHQLGVMSESLVAAETRAAGAEARVQSLIAERDAVWTNAESASAASTNAAAVLQREEEETARLRTTLSEVTSRVHELEAEVAFMRQQGGFGPSAAAAAAAAVAAADARATAHEASLSQHKALFLQLDRAREAAASQLAAALAQLAERDAQVTVLAREMHEAKKAASSARESMTVAQSDRASAQVRLDAAVERLADLSKAMEALRRGQSGRLAELEAEISGLKRTVTLTRKEAADAAAERDAAVRDISFAAADVASLTKDNASLSEQLNAARHEAGMRGGNADPTVRAEAERAFAELAVYQSAHSELLMRYESVCEERTCLLAEVGTAEGLRAKLASQLEQLTVALEVERVARAAAEAEARDSLSLSRETAASPLRGLATTVRSATSEAQSSLLQPPLTSNSSGGSPPDRPPPSRAWGVGDGPGSELRGLAATLSAVSARAAVLEAEASTSLGGGAYGHSLG